MVSLSGTPGLQTTSTTSPDHPGPASEQRQGVQLQEEEQQAPQLRIEHPEQRVEALNDWQKSRKRSIDAVTNGGANLIKRPKRRNKNRKNYAAIDKGYSSGEDGEQVRLTALDRHSEALRQGWCPQQFSKKDKAAQVALSGACLQVTSTKGYCMARAVYGAHEGTWYMEMTATHLGETGHVRLGWATRKAELQAPVGYDSFSYGYRDLEGSKVHSALREEFGLPFREGDVIGCLLHLPPGGLPLQIKGEEIVMYKSLPHVVEPEGVPKPRPLLGSLIAFSVNGESQGAAYRDIIEGTYHPAVSMYCGHGQKNGPRVTANFGPDFKYPPLLLGALPLARSAAEMAGSPPVDSEDSDSPPGTAAEGDGGAVSGAAGAVEGTAAGQREADGTFATSLEGFAPESSYCNPVQSAVEATV